MYCMSTIQLNFPLKGIVPRDFYPYFFQTQEPKHPSGHNIAWDRAEIYLNLKFDISCCVVFFKHRVLPSCMYTLGWGDFWHTKT